MKRTALLALAAALTVPAVAHSRPSLARRNQPPVAVITVTSKKPLINGSTRYYFSGTGSYDTDGTITQYYWYPDSYCRMDGAYSTTYYMDVPSGETCGLTLTVTDNEGATGSELKYYTGL